MKKIGTLLLTLTIALMMAACGKTEYKPSPIDESVDKCPVCKMAVADNPFAVEIILKSQKALKFDDLGDLFVWKAENGTKEIGEQFVRDYNTKEWIKLKDAVYVYDKTIRTPMAYNVISFKDKKAAEAFVAQEGKGEVWDANKLDEHKWEPNEEMMKQMMQEHADEMTGGTGKDKGDTMDMGASSDAKAE
ncbi:nitrous oxide reductase accessory protein NosL [Cohnella soli]|uniref:Nitrous oxide reductase accessory protein NosL n=1 Tax=Cohnella soli TaxID=425005 RepID=A0ABW0I0L7_9BACL